MMCVGRCPASQSLNSDHQQQQSPGIFDDLTAEEIESIISYTKENICLGQPDESPHGNVSTIAVIELRPPPKHSALRYLDTSGSAPGRYARVVLYR